MTPDPAEVQRVKRDFRKRMVSLRDALPAETRAAASWAIQGRLAAWEPYRAARRIALFAAMRSEVDTGPIIEHALAAGKEVCLPVSDVAARVLRFHPIAALADLAPGAYGIREPDPQGREPVDPATFDLIATPGAAFDEGGGRIGYGGGYYDRVLERAAPRATVVALAFDVQVVLEVPAEPHDRRVGWIVTETRRIRCAVQSNR